MASINASTSGAGGVITTADSSGVLNLQSGGSNVATINAYGIGLGTGVPSSGIGITFPATQSASSDANTLDDYEEGTWTPVFVGSTTAGSCTYNTGVTNGAYVKIGQLVYTTFSIVATSSHTGTGALLLNGLPFATSSTASFGGSPSIGYWGSLAVNITYISAYTGGGSSGFQIQYSTAAQTTITTAAPSLIVNNSHLIGTFVYRASA
jgi:hypothetical protein